MTKKKKIITGGTIVLAAIIVIVAVTSNKPTAITTIKTEELTKRTLSNTISTTGVVESIDSTNVYSSLTTAVKTVNVSVGDKVDVGTVLCQLETKDLESDIAKQQASIDNANKSAQLTIQSNQATYNTAKSNLDTGLNSQIVSADSTLASSKASLDSALKKYQDAKNNMDNNVNSQITSAESNVETAQISLDDALRAYNNAKSDLDNDNNSSINSAEKSLNTAEDNVDTARDNWESASDTEKAAAKEKYETAKDTRNAAEDTLEQAKIKAERDLEDYQSKYDAAQISYDNAVASRDATIVSENQNLENLKVSYETALTSYDNAVKSKTSTLGSAQETVDTYKNNVTSSKISADNTADQIALDKLKTQLNDSTITSPVLGTITAVYAKVGTSTNGILFVIENTDSLQIATTIKEYDVDNAQLGMDTTIKTDATGDTVFSGTVSSISPAAVKASDGTTQTDTNVEFDTEIAVASEHDGLRIGMNARINIILEQKENVYGVPYDAVVTDKDGNSKIYVAQKDKSGAYIAKSLAVTTGLETDFYIEVSGEELSDGILIITNHKNIIDGAKVQVEQ